MDQATRENATKNLGMTANQPLEKTMRTVRILLVLATVVGCGGAGGPVLHPKDAAVGGTSGSSGGFVAGNGGSVVSAGGASIGTGGAAGATTPVAGSGGTSADAGPDTPLGSGGNADARSDVPAAGSGGGARTGGSSGGSAGGSRDAGADIAGDARSGGNASDAGKDASGGGGAGTGGGAGGVSGSGGAPGSGGQIRVDGGLACTRVSTDDVLCQKLNYPPNAFFCRVGAQRPSSACVMYNGVGSGDFYCCPDQYLACPDSPPSKDSACTGSLSCTYGSHPDPNCRTRATCSGGTWQVSTVPARCSDPLLPAACPASPPSNVACSPATLSCYYSTGSFCSCTNCPIEAPNCNIGNPDTWYCWTPPGGDCPTFFPNLGSVCSLPAGTRCRYTCASIATCSAQGVWVSGGVACPECNAPDTPIATPTGDRAIASLAPGDLVYSIHQGQVSVVPIAEVGRKVQHNHHVMRLALANGSVLEISPRHPTADGRAIGDLVANDLLDGVRIVSAALVPYGHSHTYDILPASDTGTYYAGGVLIGSTMAPAR